MSVIKSSIGWVLIVFCTGFFLSGCSKSFEETDPLTGLAIANLTSSVGECSIIKITQKNRDYTSIDNSFQIERDTAFLPTRMYSYDSIAHKPDYDISITVSGDSIKLSTGEYLLVDPSSKYITTLSTKQDITDPNSDDELCRYFYNSQGYLIKKLIYLNASATPSYETLYNYDNNLLVSCVLYAGSSRDKFIESTLTYDTTKTVKPWAYLFTDFFEGYNYLQAFNFGKKCTKPVQTIITKVYDTNNGSIYDTWTTGFTGYVFSKDGFVLQTTVGGDQQQGLGLLFGITRFEYKCTK
jgi:hypothetical protein